MLPLQPVALPVGGARLAAELAGPAAAAGVVVIARGTGSCRHDPGHRSLADRLHRARLATLLVDLLTDAEEREALAGGATPDQALLADRMVGVVDWAAGQPLAGGRPLGLVGSGAASAAALAAASRRPDRVRAVAVVPRGHPLHDAAVPGTPVLAVVAPDDERPTGGRGQLQVVEAEASAGPHRDRPGVEAAAESLAGFFPRAFRA